MWLDGGVQQRPQVYDIQGNIYQYTAKNLQTDASYNVTVSAATSQQTLGSAAWQVISTGAGNLLILP